MASKLSMNNVHADMVLAQIKTGEYFTVQMVDLVAKKVTITDATGEEKVVSKATLERWYRELTEDELQKFNESEQAEQANESSNGDADPADAEAEQDADESGDENVEEGPDADGGDTPGEDTGVDGESAGDDGNGSEGNIEDSEAGDGDNNSADEVGSPVTPSNAGKDRDKAKEPRKQEPKNAALMKVRQTIIDTILADSESIQLKKTTSYDVLKEKHNFAEITHGSNRFNVSVMSKCLTEDQMNKVKINPASFGWSIDADFTVFDESDIDMAVQLIRQSREYRLANPVTRKKKEKK